MALYNPRDAQSVEKYSSAVTLSDMEIFIFPELLYSLVLANIMSPALWKWREDPWFTGVDLLNDYRRLLRTKQFIMDQFTFNLDLDTWGLTTKERELSRFTAYIEESVLAQSNALFGYEGDKYYFDIDIRRHFGLDKYDTSVIPYWKTETLEAMEAFRYKYGYTTSAGECVSLSTLYAAALFVVAQLPLENIHLMATPLHSQNYIDIKEGVLTNNRRIVTKNMWFNGSELTAKARRALENEKVTMVANNTGYIHTMYEHATIEPSVYASLSTKLVNFLRTDITFEILASFLRQNSSLQKCFQLTHSCCGKPRYIEIEKVFHYEHNSKSRIGEESQSKLLHEIDEDEFYTSPVPGRIILDELESFFKNNRFPIDAPDTADRLKSSLCHGCYNVNEVIGDLVGFCQTIPRLPSHDKTWQPQAPIVLKNSQSREEITEYLLSIRDTHPIADLAFMAFRDMNHAPWKPFLKAAFERNPVSISGSKIFDIDQIYVKLSSMVNESIYDSSRMAQPDEVWNFNRGDGLEKALCLMNVIKSQHPDKTVELTGDGKEVVVSIKNGKDFKFTTQKNVSLPEKEDFNF